MQVVTTQQHKHRHGYVADPSTTNHSHNPSFRQAMAWVNHYSDSTTTSQCFKVFPAQAFVHASPCTGCPMSANIWQKCTSQTLLHVCRHHTCMSAWVYMYMYMYQSMDWPKYMYTCMQLMYNTKYMYVNEGMATHIYMDTHMYNVHVFCMLSCMQDGTVGQQLHMSRPKSIGMCISGTSADSRIANCSQDIILTILLTQPQSCQQI